MAAFNPIADVGTAPPWLRRPKPATDFDSALTNSWTPNANVQAMFPGMGATDATNPIARPATSPFQSNLPGSTDSAPKDFGPQVPGGIPPAAPGPGPAPAGAPGSGTSPEGETFASYYKNQQEAIAQKYLPAIAAGGPGALAAQAAWRQELDNLAPAPGTYAGGGEIPPAHLNKNSIDANGQTVLGGANTFTPSGPSAPAAPTPQKSLPFTAAAPVTPGEPSNGGVATKPQTVASGVPPLDRTSVDYATGLPSLDTDFAGAAAKGADATYKGATQFFEKDFGRDRAALETQLMNQGFVRGTEAFDNEMEKLTRSQNATRENAGFTAQGVGHAQAGDLLQRALASRASLVGERERGADRTFGQSATGAQLGLNARGQDISSDVAKYGTDASAALALRRLGLDENSQQFQQLMQLIASSRGGVNMPSFGAPAPLDVTGANSIAASADANRQKINAANKQALYGLGAEALGNVDWASFFK